MGDDQDVPSQPGLRLTRRALLLAAMGGAAAAALPGSAAAGPRAAWWPPIVPRSEWDGGACKPTSAPDVGPPVQRVIVHHTAIFARYAPGEAAGAIRQMCINHIRNRGFSDIAYHLLIDRYGVIYQGRAGSILAPIVGAHAQGFNFGSVGVALIGNFHNDTLPEPTRVSLVRTIAWLSQLHGFDPAALTPHTSTGGPSSLVPEGITVQLPGIVPHGRLAPSDCPGRHVERYINTGRLLEHVRGELARHPLPGPSPSPTEAATGGAVGKVGRVRDATGGAGDDGDPDGPVERVIDRIVDRLTPG